MNEKIFCRWNSFFSPFSSVLWMLQSLQIAFISKFLSIEFGSFEGRFFDFLKLLTSFNDCEEEKTSSSINESCLNVLTFFTIFRIGNRQLNQFPVNSASTQRFLKTKSTLLAFGKQIRREAGKRFRLKLNENHVQKKMCFRQWEFMESDLN